MGTLEQLIKGRVRMLTKARIRDAGRFHQQTVIASHAFEERDLGSVPKFVENVLA
jgi:hypothetical protein